ncbi:MAG: hypothetical protein D4R58_00975, partial [Betaproteobacteria bacterium]
MNAVLPRSRRLVKHQPRKRFGQNFLVDAGVIAAIVAAIHPARADRIVEIGPGLGALTRPLLAAVEQMDAIEIDRDLADALKREFAPRLTVHAADVLGFDFATRTHTDSVHRRLAKRFGFACLAVRHLALRQRPTTVFLQPAPM